MNLFDVKVHFKGLKCVYFKPFEDGGGRYDTKIYIQLLESFCALILLSSFDIDKWKGFREVSQGKHATAKVAATGVTTEQLS